MPEAATSDWIFMNSFIADVIFFCLKKKVISKVIRKPDKAAEYPYKSRLEEVLKRLNKE